MTKKELRNKLIKLGFIDQYPVSNQFELKIGCIFCKGGETVTVRFFDFDDSVKFHSSFNTGYGMAGVNGNTVKIVDLTEEILIENLLEVSEGLESKLISENRNKKINSILSTSTQV